MPASHVDRDRRLADTAATSRVNRPIPGGRWMAQVRVLGPLVLARSDHPRGGRRRPLAFYSHPPLTSLAYLARRRLRVGELDRAAGTRMLRKVRREYGSLQL